MLFLTIAFGSLAMFSCTVRLSFALVTFPAILLWTVFSFPEIGTPIALLLCAVRPA